MSGASIKQITDADFDVDVIQSSVPVLVVFWATWCRACSQIAPIIQEIADVYPGRIDVVKIDIDQYRLTAQYYDVRRLPALLIFKGGEVVGQLYGFNSRAKIEAELASHVSN